MSRNHPHRDVVHPPLSSVALLAGSLVLLPSRAAAQGVTERVSVASNGSQADGQSLLGAISPDGRFLAFESFASNLVPGDTNLVRDVFLRDLSTGSTTRVSVSSSGAEANGESALWRKSISSDGRYVAFSSGASDLVPGDGNGQWDVFVHDLQIGSTIRASLDPAGGESDGNSHYATLSADGRFLAFMSYATNLAPLTSDTLVPQIYVRDMTTGQTVLASVNTAGAQCQGYATHPELSADGRTLVFRSDGTNFVAGETGFIGMQIYVRDLASGVTTRASVSSQGRRAMAYGFETHVPSISADGRLVAFQSRAGNLVPGDDDSSLDVFVHDRLTATTTRVSVSSRGTPGDGDSGGPCLSPDGRFVAFGSDSSDLVPGDGNGHGDAFLRDLLTGSTTRINLRTDGIEGSGAPPDYVDATASSSISQDGRFIAFWSLDTNLVAGDTNGVADTFVHDRAAPLPNAYCLSKVDSRGCAPAMSSAGVPSASGSAAFDVLASSVQSGRRGILFYSLGSDRERLGGGVLCVAPPLRRAAILSSGGNVAAHDCTGSFSFDFNARIRSGVDPDLVPGTVAYAQYFYRDPTGPAGNGTGLSDALRFAIQP